MERVPVELALPRGQEMITNFSNGTNGIRLGLEDMILAIKIYFATGFSLTCETGAGLDSGREKLLLI